LVLISNVGPKKKSFVVDVYTGFRSESEFIKEREMRGSSSFNYDDVDEANEVVPLTPPGFTVAGPRKNNMTGGAFNQSDGKF